MDKIWKVCSKIVAVIGIFVFLFLTIYAWRYTKRLLFSEYFSNERDSILCNALICVGVLVLVFGIRKVTEHISSVLVHVVAILCSVGVTVFCIYFAGAADAYCVGDAEQIYVTAGALFEGGDLSWMREYDYFKVYPFQLGLAYIYSLFFRLSGQSGYFVIYCVQALLSGISVYAGYRITKELFCSRATEIVYLIAIIAFCPMYCYSLFIYGEAIGVCFALLSIWCFLTANREKNRIEIKILCWILTAVFMTIVYIVRSALIVIWIAMAVIQLFFFLQKRNWRPLITVGIILPVMLTVQKLPIKAVEKQADTEFTTACPAVMWVAMGFQEEKGSNRGPGTFNDFNRLTFIGCEYDEERASQIAWESISQQWKAWLHNPKEMVGFFKEKSLIQWIEPTYGALVMTCYFIEPQEWVQNLYYGEQSEVFLKFMNGYQGIVYLAILGYYVIIMRGKADVRQLLPGVALLGGFFFSLIWEAKSRYVYPYMVMILPCVAYCMVFYSERTFRVLKKTVAKVEKCWK